MLLKMRQTVLQVCFALFSILITFSAIAQQRRVTGRVLGADGKPVAGASVVVNGTTTGTQTDAAGNFVISVPGGKDAVTISSVGFETLNVAVPGTNRIAATLRTTTSNLNEIVVTGYSAQRKKDITGAVAVVNVNNMKQQPAGTGEEALQGQASGVNVITSGQPGAASDIRIRGINSFGNNQPLVIIDGTPGNLHDINVNDIESVQVLKDASASIYGVRGSNGVIVVTTKKGKTGRSRVTYDGYYGFTQPGKGYDMANPQEEADAVWQQLRNSGYTPDDTTGKWGSKQFGTGVNPVVPEYIFPTGFTPDLNNPRDLDSVNPARYNINSYQITKANKAGTNWYKEIMKQRPMTSHNVSVSGGAEKSSYLFSLGYINQQGTMLNTYLKRYSVRANTLFNIKDRIRAGENAYIYYKDNPRVENQSEGNPLTTAFRESSMIPIYDIMGNYAGTKAGDLGNARNPYADVARRANNRGNEWSFSGNVFAEVDLLRHLTARTQFGGTVRNGYYYNFNYTGYENAEGNNGANSFTEGADYDSRWTWTNTATYTNTFGIHSVRGLIGYEANSFKTRYLSGTRSNYFSTDPTFWALNTGSPSGQTNAGRPDQGSINSMFAQVNYNYGDRYLINGTLRRDGASVFFTGYRYGWFPSVSAAWRISGESFMKGVTFLNDLKLRYSWGKLGSYANVSGANAYTLYALSAGRSFYDLAGTSTQPEAGIYNSQIGNPSTSWEGDIISNAGLDATLFHNKIDLSIEWYKKKVSGLLFEQQGSNIVLGGGNRPLINIGNMQNTGIDANVTYHGGSAKGLKYDVTATFTSYNNKIVSIPGSGYFETGGSRHGNLVRNQVGQAVGAFYGYEVLGLFQSDDDVSKSPTQSGAAPGRFKFRDISGADGKPDGKIDANDRTFFGNPNPDFNYGLNISLSYKNFDFSTFLFGSYGNDVLNYTKLFTDFPQLFKGGIRREAAVNAWRPDNLTSKIPKLEFTGGFSTTETNNSYYMEDGSYLRNKQMQLGYTVPASGLTRLGIDRLRIYVQAANLFTITKYSGLDPELQSVNPNAGPNDPAQVTFGIDYGNYPHQRSFIVGVNLGF